MPVIAYDIPVCVHSKLERADNVTLAREGTIAGLKDSSGDDGTSATSSPTRGQADFFLMTGSEIVVDSALAMGATVSSRASPTSIRTATSGSGACRAGDCDGGPHRAGATVPAIRNGLAVACPAPAQARRASAPSRPRCAPSGSSRPTRWPGRTGAQRGGAAKVEAILRATGLGPDAMHAAPILESRVSRRSSGSAGARSPPCRTWTWRSRRARRWRWSANPARASRSRASPSWACCPADRDGRVGAACGSGGRTARTSSLQALTPSGCGRSAATTSAMVFQEPMTSLNPSTRSASRSPSRCASTSDPRARRSGGGRRAPRPRRHSRPRARAATQYPHELSGGMRQRAMIAMALACDPRCSSPTSRPPRSTSRSRPRSSTCCSGCRRERGMAILFVTHDLGVVAEIADRVAVMYAGQIVETGTVADVFAHPRHPYTVGLMRSVPKLGEATELKRRGPPLPTIAGAGVVKPHAAPERVFV